MLVLASRASVSGADFGQVDASRLEARFELERLFEEPSRFFRAAEAQHDEAYVEHVPRVGVVALQGLLEYRLGLGQPPVSTEDHSQGVPVCGGLGVELHRFP